MHKQTSSQGGNQPAATYLAPVFGHVVVANELGSGSWGALQEELRLVLRPCLLGDDSRHEEVPVKLKACQDLHFDLPGRLFGSWPEGQGYDVRLLHTRHVCGELHPAVGL